MNHDKVYLKIYSFVQYVAGTSRVCLVDYAHDSLFYLPTEYYHVLKALEEKDINTISQELDDVESVIHLHRFIEKLVSLGMAIRVSEPNMLPSISESLNDEFQLIQNSIIELSSNLSIAKVKSFCTDLSRLNCTEVQLWIIDNDMSLTSIEEIIQHLAELSFTYVDIHMQETGDFGTEEWSALIEKYAILKKIIVYGAKNDDTHDVVHLIPPHPPLSLGLIEFVTNDFSKGKCCGEIQFSSLDFSGYWISNLLKRKNGCLYKKICLDRNGMIKHCPCLNFNYGVYKHGSLAEVIKSDLYNKMCSICNDDISTCKDCEYRYNCTGCRAFTDNDDLFGKPKKCHYNPYDTIWE